MKTNQFRQTLGSSVLHCEESAPGSLFTKSVTGLSTRSHSIHSPLSSRTHSPHSLNDIPSPPQPPNLDTGKSSSKKKRRGKEVTSVPGHKCRDNIERRPSYDKLDAVSVVTYSDSHHQQHNTPLYSDLRSMSADQQPETEQPVSSSLYRTLSRATLIDQDTGNVYQVS